MVAPPKSVYFWALILCASSSRQAVDITLSFSVSVMTAGLHSFPKHPGQSCTFADGQKWIEAVVRLLPSDWSSLYHGSVPRTLLQYTPLAVPAALVVGAGGAGNAALAVSQSAVSQRDLEIAKTTDANNLRRTTRTSHEAEIRNDFFLALENSLFETAKLLLSSLHTAHPLAFNAQWFDGPAALQSLAVRYNRANIRMPEATTHDDYLIKLRLQPLPDNV
jgi:hypothetical protein